MQAKFLKNFLGFKRGDFARPPSVCIRCNSATGTTDGLVRRPNRWLSADPPCSQQKTLKNPCASSHSTPTHSRSRPPISSMAAKFRKTNPPPLFLKMRFDTMRTEPVKRFTSSRKALPTRNGVLGRRAWDPTFFTETDLRFHATYCWNIPRDLPAKCQLPEIIPIGTHGRTIHRPAAWAKGHVLS